MTGTEFSYDQHREYLRMIDRNGAAWLEIFQGDTEFYSAVFWDLFTGLWRDDQPMRKTDAMGLMSSVRSAHTAGKYLDTAVSLGAIVESGNPEDARSRLVELSPDMRARLDGFFDNAVAGLRTAGQRIEQIGGAGSGAPNQP